MSRRHSLLLAIVSLSAVTLLLAVSLPSAPSEPVASGSDECGSAFQLSDGLPAVEPVISVLPAAPEWMEHSRISHHAVPRAVPRIKTVSPRSPPVLS